MFFPRARHVAAASIAALVALPPQWAAAEDIAVFAAASLKTALDAIVADWRAGTGNTATVSYGGSALLARQIEQGAPADVFISASPEWMDHLADRGHVDAATRHDLLGNSLVLIAHGREATPVDLAPDLDLAGMLGDGRLAMALVDAVPAGMYGKAALTSLGLWDAVAPKVAQVDNVRAALALVSTGEAPFGIVYGTDATAEDDVAVVGTFPPETHPPIVYPAAVTAESAVPEAAADFLDFLRGDRARQVFEAHGFTVLG